MRNGMKAGPLREYDSRDYPWLDNVHTWGLKGNYWADGHTSPFDIVGKWPDTCNSSLKEEINVEKPFDWTAFNNALQLSRNICVNVRADIAKAIKAGKGEEGVEERKPRSGEIWRHVVSDSFYIVTDRLDFVRLASGSSFQTRNPNEYKFQYLDIVAWLRNQ